MVSGAIASPVSHSVEDERFRMKTVVLQLGETQAGKRLLQKARRYWNVRTDAELLSHLGWSTISKTDAVLTRKFDPKTGEESRDRHVNVFLKRDQSVAETVLDLAHELVHATEESGWDPYDPSLRAVDYIHQSIEGRGGEVEAVYQECLVSVEIAPVYVLPYDRCARYTTEHTVEGGHDHAHTHHSVQRKKIVDDFYRVGEQYESLVDRLGAHAKRLVHLSGADANLISSTWNEPYPLALYLEFEAMTASACKNSERRLARLERKAARAPASAVIKNQRKRTQQFLKARCEQKLLTE
jgi:hypothetical protein